LGIVFEDKEIQILFEDADLIAINKPAGLRTLPDGYHKELPNVMELMGTAYGKIWMLHRLDKETSGVLVLAKNSEAHRIMDRKFANHQIKKTYFAIVCGIFNSSEKVLEYPLLVNGDRAHRTIIDMKGKKAVTIIEDIKIKKDSLLKIKIESGYTHQIRAHLSFIGFPIINDSLYGGQKTEIHGYPISRIALHAYQLTFEHPFTHALQTIIAPFPDDFNQVLSINLWHEVK
jgi:RluA family pseudouridine synthase